MKRFDPTNSKRVLIPAFCVLLAAGILMALNTGLIAGFGTSGKALARQVEPGKTEASAAEKHPGEGEEHSAGHDQGLEREPEEGHADEVQLTPEAMEASGIQVGTVGRHPMEEGFVVPGRVSFNTEAMAHVGTPVPGRVAEIRFRLGDEIEQGQVLLVIDSSALGEAQSDFLLKLNQVRVAESALEVAQTAAERAQRLLDSKGISLGEYQKREGEMRAARGALLTAQTAAAAAENNLRLWGMDDAQLARLVETGEIDPRYAVKAAIAGRVIAREATLGEIVGPDRDALLVLADMRTLWVLAHVPEHRVHRVVLGSSATVTLDAIPDRSYLGRITFIDSALDPSTRSALVRVEVEDGDRPLKPGMFVHVRVETAGVVSDASGGTAVAVPAGSVQIVEGRPAVFVEVAGEPNTFAARSVEVGAPVNGMVPILAGLEEGNRFACDGAFLLKAELAKSIMEGKTCSGH